MDIRKIAEGLIGTCNSCEEINDFTMEECAEFDTIVFCCSSCDWWCSMDEGHDDESGQGFVCDECFKGEEDEE